MYTITSHSSFPSVKNGTTVGSGVFHIPPNRNLNSSDHVLVSDPNVNHRVLMHMENDEQSHTFCIIIYDFLR